MQSFIKVSNEIFNYELSPKAMMVYVYLSGRVNCLQSVTIAVEKLSCACNMDSKTVRLAIKELEVAGLVSKHNRFNARGYLANRYYVKNIVKNTGWFKVEREVFSTQIKAVDFTVFCYAKMCRSQKGEAFPSLTKIAEKTNISRGRVAKAVAFLKTYTYLNRIHRKYRKTRAFRHNRYIAFKCNRGKRKVRPLHTEKRTKNNINCSTYILVHIVKKVNRFLLI